MQCIHADTLYTGKEVLTDAYVSFDGQKIAAVGSKRQGELAGSFPVVTPAFIDGHNHMGMARAGEPSGEAEYNEKMDSFITMPDALDSIQLDDSSFTDAIEMGVLYSCVMPGSGNIIGGLSAVVRHWGSDTTSALVARAGLKAAFGYNPMSTVEWKGTRPSTRMGALSILRGKLAAVRDKMEKRRKGRATKAAETELSAADRVLEQLLSRKLRLRAHAHKADDIAALLRIVDEYNLDVTVEHAADVHQVEIYGELRRRGIPVIFGPVDCFACKTELRHETWRNIRFLMESGVTFGLMSDHPVTPSRQLLLQTRWFLRAGLTKQQVIELLTRTNAHILGLDQLGTLERNKWASLVCWNGDPFQLASFPTRVIGEGKVLFEEGQAG